MKIHHETIRLEKSVSASPTRVFAAYRDPTQREIWSAPSETAAVKIEHTDFRTGGVEMTRCGDKDDLRYRTEVRYHLVRDNELISFSETLIEDDNVLMAALITFELQPLSATETLVIITDQITSFIGQDGVEGHRQGFSAALQNLATYVESTSLL